MKTLPTFHCDSAHAVPVIYYDFSATVGTDSFFFFFLSATFMRGIKHEWEQNVANSMTIFRKLWEKERDKSFFLSSLAVAI